MTGPRLRRWAHEGVRAAAVVLASFALVACSPSPSTSRSPPTEDRGFVPQCVALDGRTAWVSGYRWQRDFGQRACHLLHVSLGTGRLLAPTDRLVGRIGQRSETFCRHGGAETLHRHGLRVVGSNRLWLVEPERVGQADQVRRVWFVDRAAGPGHDARTRTGRRRRNLVVVVDLDVRDAGDSRGTPGRVLPGRRGVELAGRGRLWVTLESGSRHYQRAGRPLTPMLVEYDVQHLLHGRRASCGW